MKRIGIAASKMSKGNLTLYNLYVVLISALFSLFIFIVAGSTVVFALVVIRYVGNEISGVAFETSWQSILTICMVSLTMIITIFNLYAISRNLKFPKIKE